MPFTIPKVFGDEGHPTESFPPPTSGHEPDDLDPSTSSSGSGNNNSQTDEEDLPVQIRERLESIDNAIGITNITLMVIFIILTVYAWNVSRRRSVGHRGLPFKILFVCIAYAIYNGIVGFGIQLDFSPVYLVITQRVCSALGNSGLVLALLQAIQAKIGNFRGLVVGSLTTLGCAIGVFGSWISPNTYIAVSIVYDCFLVVTIFMFWINAKQAFDNLHTKFSIWCYKFLGPWCFTASLVLTAFDVARLTKQMGNETLDDYLTILDLILGEFITWGIATLTVVIVILEVVRRLGDNAETHTDGDSEKQSAELGNGRVNIKYLPVVT